MKLAQRILPFALCAMLAGSTLAEPSQSEGWTRTQEVACWVWSAVTFPLALWVLFSR